LSLGDTLDLGGGFLWQGGTVSGGTLVTTGAAEIAGSGPLQLDATNWRNEGTLEWSAGGFTLAGDAVLQNVGNMTISNPVPATLGGLGTVVNAGTLESSPDAEVVILAPFVNTGTLRVLLNTLVLADAGDNAGEIGVAAGATLRLLGGLVNAAGGTLAGAGTLDLAGEALVNQGLLLPGASPGTLVIDGDLVLAGGGTLALELEGTAPGQYDVVSVTGQATLGGTLQLLPFEGYQSAAGDRFPVLAYAGVQGDFAAVDNQVPALDEASLKPERGANGYAVLFATAAPVDTGSVVTVINESVVAEPVFQVEGVQSGTILVPLAELEQQAASAEGDGGAGGDAAGTGETTLEEPAVEEPAGEEQDVAQAGATEETATADETGNEPVQLVAVDAETLEKRPLVVLVKGGSKGGGAVCR
ncbi:MAG TPA: hypothetical protein VIW02_09475, partial [Gammaproteobacteria bacterium]